MWIASPASTNAWRRLLLLWWLRLWPWHSCVVCPTEGCLLDSSFQQLGAFGFCSTRVAKTSTSFRRPSSFLAPAMSTAPTRGVTATTNRSPISVSSSSTAPLLPSSVSSVSSSSRRQWFQQFAAILAGVGSSGFLAGAVDASSPIANAAAELPLAWRDYTKLAPLGNPKGSSRGSTSSSIGEGNNNNKKTTGLSLGEIAARLAVDLSQGHAGTGGYFLTGDLDESIFRDDCVFVDPTNRVSSLAQYRSALRILFDPTQSEIQLLPLNEGSNNSSNDDGNDSNNNNRSIRQRVSSTSSSPSTSSLLRVDATARTITAKIRSRGALQLPWHPYVTAYESIIVYSVDPSGLIAQQSQTWPSKTATKALQESFTPGWFRPPPQSTRPVPAAEPPAVTQLFRAVNGRRPYEYTSEERAEINQLIETVVASENTKNKFQPDWLYGKWMLVYLQPGPTGIGIDRRIPFFSRI